MLFATSCKNSFDPSSPFGIKSEITIRDFKYESELIVIDSNFLYILRNDKLEKIDLDDIQFIFTKELVHKNRTGFLLISTLSGIALGLRLEGGPSIISYAFSAFGLASLIIGPRRFKFPAPLDDNEIEQLKLYSRYPQGLSADQIMILESYYNSN